MVHEQRLSVAIKCIFFFIEVIIAQTCRLDTTREREGGYEGFGKNNTISLSSCIHRAKARERGALGYYVVYVG